MNFSYENALSTIKSRSPDDRSERDVEAMIVEPVLINALNYSTDYIHRNHYRKSKMPDFICRRSDGELDLIVEVKNLDVDLDLRPSRNDPATRIPKIQLEEYLRKRPDSKHGVFGLLTNGEEWRVCRRIKSDIVWLSSSVATTSADLADTLNPLVNREKIDDDVSRYSTDRGRTILEQIESASDHRDLIEKLLPIDLLVEHHTDLVTSVRLSDTSDESDHLFSEVHFATIGSLVQDGELPVADIYEPLRETYLLNPAITVIGIGIAFDGQQPAPASCRIFVWDGDRLHTSSLFDPLLPGTRVLRQMESLARWRDGESTDLLELLNARAIHAEFYNEIANWFKRTGTTLNDLRHLIRVLFTWFLKEHGVIEGEPFERHADATIHEQLVYLFTQALSKEPIQRDVPQRLKHLKEVFLHAPFLNGSLFNDDPNLLRSELADSDYTSVEETDTGLLTILKRYAWTLTEHDQIRSDTALDPSMIGSIFERFLALAANITPSPLAKQPDGTYYTPKDLTDEMVCDALAHDLSVNISEITFDEAFKLLHPVDSYRGNSNRFLKQSLKNKVIQRLRQVKVLDPCTGSGEFIVSVLNTFRRVERRLLGNSEYDDQQRVKTAIANQLYAVDIHPIAIQVTRFRFYLAMVSTQLKTSRSRSTQPFPNLETRITAANSLATRLRDTYELEGSFLDIEDMKRWRKIRDDYTYTHSTVAKEALRTKEEKVRLSLINKPELAADYLIEWLESESLGNENIVSQCGLPLLFGKAHWDVVIGNPPYQRPSTDEKQMAQQFGYKTAGCGDLYCLFVELGLNLVGANGVLTMVVPHSICFATQKQALRDICRQEPRGIYLRTYNNRPTAVFPPHPFIKGGRSGAESRQRVTVISTRPDAESVHASCYIGIEESLRKQILSHRPTCRQPNLNRGQWSMAGTSELVKLLVAMCKKELSAQITAKFTALTFPPTAYKFLTILPSRVLATSGRKSVRFPEDEFFYPRICLFNSTVFHAYWLMIGDAFHVLPTHLSEVSLPQFWKSESSIRAKAEDIGRKFCSDEILSRSATVFTGKSGKEFPNYDFQTHAQDLVKQADQVCIEGYGLTQYEPELLEQIQRLRHFQTWAM